MKRNILFLSSKYIVIVIRLHCHCVEKFNRYSVLNNAFHGLKLKRSWLFPH